MDQQWTQVGAAADDLLVVAGIAVLVVRQFRWRTAETRRMLRLPLLVIAAGVVSLAVTLRAGPGWTPPDALVVAELGLVAGTGAVMGAATRFRTVGGALQHRLTRTGLWLWLAFIGIRVGSLLLAARLGADLLGTSGAILLSFGVNRLVAVAVVRRRASMLVPPTEEASQGARALPVGRAPGRSLRVPCAAPDTPSGRGTALGDPAVRSACPTSTSPTSAPATPPSR